MADYLGLAGRRIAVAGGCGGIGRQLVRDLVAHGAEVSVLDLQGSLERHPPPARAVAIDARDAEQIRAAFACIGPLDGFVNLVGFAGPTAAIEAMPDPLWNELIDGNLQSAFQLARAAMPCLRQGDGAAMVLVSSGLAVKPAAGYGGYAVAKAGVLALMKLLAAEGAPTLRVNAVAPSAVATAFLSGGTGRGGDDAATPARLDIARYLQGVPLARMAQAKDVSDPVLFLLSPAAAYITGQTLHVNGGQLMV